MPRIKRAKPSPALLVAVVALVAALAGTAVGGVAVTSLNKGEKKAVKRIATKQGKKQAKRQIKKKEPKLNVNSAVSANGVKPVQVSFAAAADSGETVFVNEGGIRIKGECGGGEAFVSYTSTANDGDLFLSTFAGGATGEVSAPNWDMGANQGITTFSNSIVQTTITYRGADGTTVSGQLVQARGAGAAQCRIGGTLFVG